MAAKKLYRHVLQAVLNNRYRSVSQQSEKLSLVIQQDPLVRYITGEFKRHQATQEINCKARNEAAFLADTYRCYLTSWQKHQSLIDTYGSKGERSAKQAARLVGLELPETPTNH